jgi:chemotaxis protein methyltransferase CheR
MENTTPSGRNSEIAAGFADPLREFPFSEADFDRVRTLVKERAGIDLGASKRSLVYGRLARRLRVLGVPTFAAYIELVEDADSDEAGRFVNAITTNVTEFFRENHHFDLLARTVLPAIWARTGPSARRVRLWSAGCSTGEEPYSLAMVVRENPPPASSGPWDVKILATDLDTDVLAEARAGLYRAERLKKVGAARLARFFAPVVGQPGKFQASEALRSLITFKPLNLLEPWPMQGTFDLIVCRNVVIYFDDPTKRALVQRYRDRLAEGGYLFLGHSESLVGATTGFEPRGRTTYRKLP